MNFLGSAVKDGKPCFNSREYVDRNSYWGGFKRWVAGEKQSRYGNDKIRNCCESACQAFEAYRDSEYGPIIIDKMLKLRKGLLEIKATYERNNEIDTVSHISDSIMILDFRLPSEVKTQTGLYAPEINNEEEEKELSKTVPLPVPSILASSPSISNSLPDFKNTEGKKKKKIASSLQNGEVA